MVLATKEPSDIDVGSLTNVLASKGFTPKEVRAHLDGYNLPAPDMTRVAAFQKTAQAIESEVEDVIRDAALRLGSTPTSDEEAWIIAEASRNLGDKMISNLILEGGTSPAPDSPPKGINPKAMDVWKKMFKEHGKEISQAKKAKQWGVAVSIFKNLAKKEGYEPFVEKSAWTLDKMSPLEISYAITTLTALAENLDLLGHEILADNVDIVTAEFENRLTEKAKKVAVANAKQHFALKKKIEVISFEKFCILAAQALEALKNIPFDHLFTEASSILKNQKNSYLHDVKSHYSLYAETFEEEKSLYKYAPPEILEEALFDIFLGYVGDAIYDLVRVVLDSEAYSEEKYVAPVNKVQLKNYLQSDFAAEKIYEVVSRSSYWRDQFCI